VAAAKTFSASYTDTGCFGVLSFFHAVITFHHDIT
jgi:hypothetical protein